MSGVNLSVSENAFSNTMCYRTCGSG